MYALDTNGAGPNPLIQTQSFTVTGTKTPIDPWFQNFSSDCKRWKAKQWPPGTPSAMYILSTPSNCSDEYSGGYPPDLKYWMLESTNETYSFGPVYDTSSTHNDFTPDGQLWNFGFYPKSGGGYSIGWVIDKLNFTPTGMKKDTYSGAFFQRELGPWTTQLSSANVFIEFDLKVNSSDQGLLLNDSSTLDYIGASSRGMLLARNRVTLGLVAHSSTMTRFIEVNLFKTTNFDLCTTSTNVEMYLPVTPCESATGAPGGYDNTVGLFDRRSSYGNGQIIYYDFGQLGRVSGPSQNTISADGQWHHIRIPVTNLFRDAPWTDSSSLSKTSGLINLSGIELNALYIGHEVWGRGRVWAEFDNFQIYTFSAD